MGEYEFVGYEQDGPVVTITFDRPERMNAIGPVMSAELVEAWTRFRTDDSAIVAVLTGRGSEAFCAGGDLKDAFAGNPPVPTDPAEQAAHARGERPGILGPSRWTDIYKPTIAAVNGVAYAGGLIEAACYNTLIGGTEMHEGLRRFNERDHPDRRHDTAPTTTGIDRPRATPNE